MKRTLLDLLQRFDETRAWHWFAKNVLAHLTFRVWGYPSFDFERWPELRDVLDKAELDEDAVYAFVLADKRTLASILIRAVSKSRWSHAGWLMGRGDGNRWVVHMKGPGLLVQQVYSVLRECDDFAVVRFPTNSKILVRARLREYIRRKDTVRYDFEQELADDASPLEAEDVYCSELVWLCATPEIPLSPSVVLGRRCFSPDDVARNGEIVWQHVSSK